MTPLNNKGDIAMDNNLEVVELREKICTEVKEIRNKRILVLIYLYSHKLSERHKERERY